MGKKIHFYRVVFIVPEQLGGGKGEEARKIEFVGYKRLSVPCASYELIGSREYKKFVNDNNLGGCQPSWVSVDNTGFDKMRGVKI